jgi:flavin reductase (DIM6/NTAB) family NADH-FMN oxidoreductase RutF
MTDYHSYEPQHGHKLKHDPFSAIIAPRPIGWISSIAEDGKSNLAPYSFFNAFNYSPPIIGFSSVGWKDTVRNIAATREFTWNLVTEMLASQMNLTSADLDSGVDEFEFAALGKRSSRLVKPYCVAPSPINFECRLSQILQLDDQAGKHLDTWLVLGEVVMVHIAEHLLVDGIFKTVPAQPILRGGGAADYFRVEESARFQMRRPSADALPTDIGLLPTGNS